MILLRSIFSQCGSGLSRQAKILLCPDIIFFQNTVCTYPVRFFICFVAGPPEVRNHSANSQTVISARCMDIWLVIRQQKTNNISRFLPPWPRTNFAILGHCPEDLGSFSHGMDPGKLSWAQMNPVLAQIVGPG